MACQVAPGIDEVRSAPRSSELEIAVVTTLILGGARADVLSSQELIEAAASRWRTQPERPLAVASTNLDHIHHFGLGRPNAGSLFDDGEVDWLVTLDGMPLVWRARRLTRTACEQLAGSDMLLPLLQAAADDGVRVGFLGGRREMHERLERVLPRLAPGLGPVALWAPDRAVVDDAEASARLADEVRAAGVELLVVGLGKPRQERWLAAHLPSSGAKVGLAFGAAADFLAGEASRAPSLVRRWGLEWAYRLAREPRRLSRRYLLQGPPALWRLLRHSRSS
jgi:N-acetylglucosaminyldiphosphoundecaprenol N-acetyl-beta-D-mannosaminyltransferase